MEDNNVNQNDQSKKDILSLCEALIAPLRTEIVESEKARIDFLKYKLLAVAALGAIGLGLGSINNNTSSVSFEHIYILGIIPLVSLYVDLLCYHNTLRILIIGKYFSKMDCPYEHFLLEIGQRLRKRKGIGYFFELEDWVLEGSTWLLSLCILSLGFVFFFEKGNLMLTLIIPSVLSLCFSSLSIIVYNRKKKKLNTVSDYRKIII